ncbi:uncharacterized protein LAESUDRAFT_721682 [Laetiporus sulphureus 93-53]|uniref:Uncharacterized protein n=1 Tax=Laetiporus sulphureus 93-53 TaxID=1314785 RepID=A0A165GH82_9APHY|nr:uncharacterized protein LAESUDRAFT_721682 [Laetiporus sulphureus 93-53]KZT10344.1 hypothetical protein LAESUDRAFT_721682 [Laetiporus sulphureus 93-53]
MTLGEPNSGLLYAAMDDSTNDNQNMGEDMEITPPKPWRNLGYFAFPPNVNADGRVTFTLPVSQRVQQSAQAFKEREAEALRDVQIRLKEAAWQERCRREAKENEERRAFERAEALRGEMEWVRMGGSLLDAHGRRDTVRTERLRAKVRLLDEEARLIKLWETYEMRWRTLLAGSGPVTFQDIPWPMPPASKVRFMGSVKPTPISLEDLTQKAMEEVLFGPLKIRGNTVTRRDRIRTSLLRWHPDKFSPVLQRVVEEDTEAVREGIYTVFRHLKVLQETERQG